MNFCEEFWNDAPGVFTGTTLILEKIRVGGVISEQYVDFFKQMAVALDSFGQATEKALKPIFQKESGDLQKSGAIMLQNFKAMAKNFREASKVIEEQLYEVTENVAFIYEKRKEARDEFKKVQDELSECLKKTNLMQKNATSKLKEMKKAEDIYEACSNKVDKKNNLEKSMQARIKARELYSEAEHTYRDTIPPLNNSLRIYKDRATKIFNELQITEEQRIRNLRGSMWLMCNMFSQLSVFIDESMSNTQDALLDVYVEDELLHWISSNRTGQNFPRRIDYVPPKALSEFQGNNVANSIFSIFNKE